MSRSGAGFKGGRVQERSSAGGLFAPLQEPRRLHPLRPCGERRRRVAPAQRLDGLEAAHRWVGLEPTTNALDGRCSTLSYNPRGEQIHP